MRYPALVGASHPKKNIPTIKKHHLAGTQAFVAFSMGADWIKGSTLQKPFVSACQKHQLFYMDSYELTMVEKVL